MVDTNSDLPDIEPADTFDGTLQPATKGSSSRKSFAKLRRELSDEELSSPAVQRMLLDEIERLDIEQDQLISFRAKFHDADKRAAILAEKFKTKVSIEILHVGCITVGAAALGYAPSIWQTQPTAGMIAIFGVVIVIAGLAAKAVKP